MKNIELINQCNKSSITIKVNSLSRCINNLSQIWIGVMESSKKGQKKQEILNYCVFLYVGGQSITAPNQEQTDSEEIKCSC